MKALVATLVVPLGLRAASLWAAAPDGRYVISVEVVTDSKTGLTWQRVVPAQAYTWSGARTYCFGLGLGGFSLGWRLPTLKELESLIDETASSPAIDANAFPDTPAQFFWSSSKMGDAMTWYVNFNWGDTFVIDKAGPLQVRCVR